MIPETEYERLFETFYGREHSLPDRADEVLVELATRDGVATTEELTEEFAKKRHWVKYRIGAMEELGYVEIEQQGVAASGRNLPNQFILKPLGRRVVEEFLLEEIEDIDESEAIIHLRGEVRELQADLDALREELEALGMEKANVQQMVGLEQRISELEPW